MTNLDFKSILNEDQYDACTTLDGPLLILAGAGSGKTTTLIYRVAYMIDQGVSPEEILLLTFTNKAADEMKRRAEDLLDDRCNQITACTFHSFCNSQLRKYGREIGLASDFTILSPGDVSDLISLIKSEHGWNKIKEFPGSKTIAAIFSSAINTQSNIFEVIKRMNLESKCERFIPDLEEICVELRKYKEARRLLDFDDLLYSFRELLHKNSAIAEKISSTYRYIMVDEYQDTNVLQEDILFALRRTNKNLAVVGDDAQGIYQFRGASIQNITQFESRIPGTKRVTLRTNYRSNNEIVRLSNDILNATTTECFEKNMHGTYDANREPEIQDFRTSADEASFILQDIKEGVARGMSYDDFAILSRNSSHAFLLEAAFTQEKIPYRKVGGTKFLEKEHVCDILAYLRVLTNATDEIAWYRVLRLFAGIGKNFSQRISALALQHGEALLLKHSYKTRAFAPALQLFYEQYHAWQSLPLPELLDAVIEHYYTMKKHQIEQMRTESEEHRAEEAALNERNREELLSLLAMAEPYTTALQFLDALSLAGDVVSGEKENGCVTVSTIHSAKGLEWDTVYVIHCADEVFPSTDYADEGTKEDNEELRCFYVAITRAAKRLVISCPRIIQIYGRPTSVEASHYLVNVERLGISRRYPDKDNDSFWS